MTFEIGICLLLIVIIILIDNIQKKNLYKDKKAIGDIGEGIVAKKLSELPEDYVIEHNVRFGCNQIDHLVINNQFQVCFVIETKYWGGKISGKINDEYWTQDKSGKEIKYFYNPVKQNSKHCNQVRRYYKGYHIYGIVVFVNNKNVPRLKCIVNENEVRDYIDKKMGKLS